MIVRILGDNQYRFPDELAEQLDKMDDPLTEAMQTGDEALFNATLAKVIAFVRENGEIVPMEEVVTSAVIVPAADMTLDDARKYLYQTEAPSQGA
ncbi:MAG TPA: hypothetical protein VGP82_09785 [Ktedonobacterales bacterium]|jgi:hypothetical protein|nr:hypothetical protein [Ktedonobacterales bacterium]